ncbi:hypothetical protein GJV56_18800 [Elizabethkingia anophelis]|uniref:hypothetical protein n=1 Tax=Elizabethkingia anophelis TaxID=1117645 RepID=UPI0012B2225F|nr:hypothetical protein GJV56_18800 [Elizabethkingia anophelis]
MSKSNNSSSSGLGLSTVVFIVFLILKLTNTINWSWWWVTAPIWISALIYALILICTGLVFIFIKRKADKKRKDLLNKFRRTQQK